MKFPTIAGAFVFMLAGSLSASAQTSVTIQNITYASGQVQTVQVPSTITTGANVSVLSGAKITYQAGGAVILGPGFSAQSGSIFRAVAYPDSDGDGMPDWWEQQNGLNANSASDATQDADGDSVSNQAEYRLGTNPQAANALDSTNQNQLKILRPTP